SSRAWWVAHSLLPQTPTSAAAVAAAAAVSVTSSSSSPPPPLSLSLPLPLSLLDVENEDTKKKKRRWRRRSDELGKGRDNNDSHATNGTASPSLLQERQRHTFGRVSLSSSASLPTARLSGRKRRRQR